MKQTFNGNIKWDEVSFVEYLYNRGDFAIERDILSGEYIVLKRDGKNWEKVSIDDLPEDIQDEVLKELI